MKACKLFPPPGPAKDSIFRDRLRKVIQAAARAGKWVALCAPGGCGKTIAAAQSLPIGQGTCAWLTVPRTGADPAFLYGRFYAAVASVRGDDVADYGPMQLESALRALAALPRARFKGWLVLDDFHALDYEVQAVLPLLLKNLPGNVTPLLLGRSRLPDSFAPAQSEGRIALLDAAALAFTAEEAADLYESAGQSISGEALDGILRVTGGWAIALHAGVLTALSGEAPALPKDGAIKPGGTNLNQYIEETIWPGWDEETRHVLLCCANADTLTPALCALLSGRESVGETLLRVASEGLFVSRVNRDSYRCHDLFRDFLIERQRKELPEDEIRRLRGLLAGWLEAEKDFYAALSEYVYVRDREGIHRCLDAVSRYSINQPVETEMRFVYRHIISKLPDAFIQETPHLLATRIYAAYLAGDALVFTRWVDRMIKQMPQIAARSPELAESFSFVNSLDFRVPMFSHAAQTAQMLERMPPSAPDEEKQAARTISVTQNLPLFHRSMRDYSEYHALRGEDLVLLRKSFGVMIGPEYAIMEHCLVGGLLYEQGNYLDALQQAFVARNALSDNCGGETVLIAQALVAAVLTTLGAREEARRVYAETSCLLQRRSAEYLEANLRALSTRLCIEEGGLSEARSWLTYFAPDRSAPLAFYQMARHFTTLSAHIALRDWAAAEPFGTALLDLAAAYRRPLDELEALSLLAVGAYHGRKADLAADYARRGLRIAARYGYTRILKDHWQSLAPVFKALLKEERPLPQRSGAFLCGLIQAWDVAEKPGISPRQRVIALGLKEGRTYEAIAQRLGISKSSVKTHVSRMYKTLGVDNARAAVDKAEALGLLDG